MNNKPRCPALWLHRCPLLNHWVLWVRGGLEHSNFRAVGTLRHFATGRRFIYTSVIQSLDF